MDFGYDMFYRRKIILALLDQFGGTLPKTDFQKYLFLYTQESGNRIFDFVPYKFGCFSFQAQQDISTMIKYNQIEDADFGWRKTDNKEFISDLNMKDRLSLVRFFNKYKNLKSRDLIKYVYQKYPYYAINSEIAEKLLTKDELLSIQNQKPKSNTTALYTIGYEGKSVEEYANILIRHDIRILIDVRKNSNSMKYGFSKNQLKNVMQNVGIEFVHFPQLGIVSDKRKQLNTYQDYQKLFKDYETDVLPNQMDYIKEIDKLINSKKRAALTCFEANHNYCHRSKVAEAVFNIEAENINVIHL